MNTTNTDKLTTKLDNLYNSFITRQLSKEQWNSVWATYRLAIKAARSSNRNECTTARIFMDHNIGKSITTDVFL